MSEYKINGSTVFDISDGTVIDLNEVRRAKEKEAINTFNNSLGELDKLGISSNLTIVNHRNVEYRCVEIKRDFEFNKNFRVEVRDLMLDNELTKNARCFIGTITPFISFPSNAIHVRYKNPTYKQLLKIMDMSLPTLTNTLNELEQKNIIVKIKINGQMVIYFNCFLYIAGFCVEKSTYDLFVNSIYNPIKV